MSTEPEMQAWQRAAAGMYWPVFWYPCWDKKSRPWRLRLQLPGFMGPLVIGPPGKWDSTPWDRVTFWTDFRDSYRSGCDEMPWKKLLVLLSCMLLLSGCAGTRDPTEKALLFRTSLMEAGGCTFHTNVIAHYEDRAYAFSMSCNNTDGRTELTVTAPENIAGITAVVESGETQLAFDGTILEFGKLANGYVSPVAVPWLLVQCWIGEYIAYAGPDGDQERITYLRGYNDEELSVDTWLRDGVPTYAEVTYDGVRCLAAEITDFQLSP